MKKVFVHIASWSAIVFLSIISIISVLGFLFSLFECGMENTAAWAGAVGSILTSSIAAVSLIIQVRKSEQKNKEMSEHLSELKDKIQEIEDDITSDEKNLMDKKSIVYQKIDFFGSLNNDPLKNYISSEYIEKAYKIAKDIVVRMDQDTQNQKISIEDIECLAHNLARVLLKIEKKIDKLS
mgnify:CR=1 FL=1